jgi:DNA-directed RNA polymerase specialized sigma24 family protein
MHLAQVRVLSEQLRVSGPLVAVGAEGRALFLIFHGNGPSVLTPDFNVAFHTFILRPMHEIEPNQRLALRTATKTRCRTLKIHPDFVEDVITEVLLKAAKGQPFDRQKGDLAAWANMHAFRGASDWLSKYVRNRRHTELLDEQFEEPAAALADEEDQASVPLLTPCELDVLKAYMVTDSDEDIARLLKYPHPRTPRWHLANVRKKFGVRSTHRALLKAMQMGLIPLAHSEAI